MVYTGSVCVPVGAADKSSEGMVAEKWPGMEAATGGIEMSPGVPETRVMVLYSVRVVWMVVVVSGSSVTEGAGATLHDQHA